MNDRQSIIGFTEAELGFFLTLLCVVLWVMSTAAQAPEPPPEAPTLSVEIAPESLAILRADRARLMQTTRARDSLQRLVDSLRSPIWPSCSSRRVAAGPLLTLVALGAGRYRVGGDTVTVADVNARTAAERARATAAQCRHEVRLGFRRDLSAPEYEAARGEIGSLMLRLLRGPQTDQ